MTVSGTIPGKDMIGRTYEPFTIEVEKGRIAQFANAIGETDPVYFDEAAAKAAGFSAIPAPLTFAYTITLDAGQSFNVLEDMGVEKTRAVHGAQGFSYYGEIFAGDTISGHQKIVDAFDKKDGALTFILTDTALSNQHGTHVADLHSTIVIKNR